MGLDAFGIHIPVLRQVILLIYISFVPGILILRTLRLHKLGNIEVLLYSAGLSVSAIMFMGFFMNAVYPSLGILRPISTMPLVVTMNVLILGLSAISYFRDSDFADPSYVSGRTLLSPPVLLLIIIPLLAIIGTQLVNLYGNNLILMLLIVLIAAVVILISCNTFIPPCLYPLAIFVIGLSLFFHRSLITNYVIGFDIHDEYYLANLVITNGIWDSMRPAVYNSMLSITMLAPIESIMSGMSLTWVLKIVYPLLLALIPLGLYRVFQKQTDDRVAFLASFFFVAPYQLYADMPIIFRQGIATFFIVLLASLIVDRFMSRTKKAVLLLFVLASTVVSHYGISYIYMFFLVFAWPMFVLSGSTKVQHLVTGLRKQFSRYMEEMPATNQVYPNPVGTTVNISAVVFLIVFALAWYMYNGRSAVFAAYVGVGKYVMSGITDFLNPDSSQVLTIITNLNPGLLYNINILISFLSPILIVIGMLALLFGRSGLKFGREYVMISLLSLGLIIAVVLVPFLSASASVGRITNVSFIFLAPFCIIGGIEVCRAFIRLFKVPWSNRAREKSLIVVTLYLVAFFMFQTGFVWEVKQENWLSTSISQKSIMLHGNTDDKAALYASLTSGYDVFSAKWLSANREPTTEPNGIVYATYNDVRVHPLVSYGMIPMSDIRALTRTLPSVSEGAYVYLQYMNVVTGIATEFNSGKIGSKAHTNYEMSELSHIYEHKNRLYTNGGSEIYFGGS